jgi:mannose-6-phosphate isomerase-like protein (cupin superfamily)
MNVFAVEQLIAQLPAVDVSPNLDADTAMRCMQVLGSFNGSAMGLVSFSGQTGWECHPGGDELLYYLEGEAELCVITEAGDVSRKVKKGDVVQVPKGLWHSQRTLSPVRLFFITPAEGMMHAAERPPG